LFAVDVPALLDEIIPLKLPCGTLILNPSINEFSLNSTMFLDAVAGDLPIIVTSQPPSLTNEMFDGITKSSSSYSPGLTITTSSTVASLNACSIVK